jgi:hypothetical protein
MLPNIGLKVFPSVKAAFHIVKECLNTIFVFRNAGSSKLGTAPFEGANAGAILT